MYGGRFSVTAVFNFILVEKKTNLCNSCNSHRIRKNCTSVTLTLQYRFEAFFVQYMLYNYEN